MTPDLLALLLAAADGPSSVEAILLNLGLPGVVIIGLAWYARTQIKAGEERYNRLEARYNAAIDLANTQWVPALTRSNELLGQATQILAEIKAREEKRAAIEEARRAFEDERRRQGEAGR